MVSSQSQYDTGHGGQSSHGGHAGQLARRPLPAGGAEAGAVLAHAVARAVAHARRRRAVGPAPPGVALAVRAADALAVARAAGGALAVAAVGAHVARVAHAAAFLAEAMAVAIVQVRARAHLARETGPRGVAVADAIDARPTRVAAVPRSFEASLSPPPPPLVNMYPALMMD